MRFYCVQFSSWIKKYFDQKRNCQFFSCLAPLSVEIFDGSTQLRDIDYQQNKDQLFATWSKLEDPDSDIVSVSWCVSTSFDRCDVIQKTSIPVSSTKLTALLPQKAHDGITYYVSLTAINGAGLSTTTISDGVSIDSKAPTAGIVVASQNGKLRYQNGNEDIRVHWFGFKDNQSSIQSYEFSLCEGLNRSSCLLEATGAGTETNVTLRGELLSNIFLVIR